MIANLFLQLAAIRLLLDILFLDLVYIPPSQKFERNSDMILPFPIDYLVRNTGRKLSYTRIFAPGVEVRSHRPAPC